MKTYDFIYLSFFAIAPFLIFLFFCYCSLFCYCPLFSVIAVFFTIAPFFAIAPFLLSLLFLLLHPLLLFIPFRYFFKLIPTTVPSSLFKKKKMGREIYTGLLNMNYVFLGSSKKNNSKISIDF